MKNDTKLVVMLTYNDKTVSNAYDIFEQCKETNATHWGFKEKPLSLDNMKLLFRYMKECGKTTILEVVEYTEEECLKGAWMAVECGCDILMGTTYFDSVNAYCKQHNLKYMPFVGNVIDRPSVLYGDIDTMIKDANTYLEKGVYGFDLLGYRYIGDASLLNKQFVQNIDAPVCIAGSVDSYNKLDELVSIKPWAFTIGSAFFDNKFDGTFYEQINKVYTYTKKSE